MKKSQTGFAIIELVIVIIILAAIAGVGYFVWHNHKSQTTGSNSTQSSAQTEASSVSVPAAPQVHSLGDLTNALSTLNQTSVSASNADSDQLDSAASGF